MMIQTLIIECGMNKDHGAFRTFHFPAALRSRQSDRGEILRAGYNSHTNASNGRKLMPPCTLEITLSL